MKRTQPFTVLVNLILSPIGEPKKEAKKKKAAPPKRFLTAYIAYSASQYQIHRLDLFRYASTGDDHKPWLFASYTPGALAKQMFGGLGGGCFGIAVVAKKSDPVDAPIVPQQGMYVKAWANQAPLARKRGGVLPDIDLLKPLRELCRRWLPLEWQVRWKAASRSFPLPVRRRF